jgi:signal transduction histidine kinase
LSQVLGHLVENAIKYAPGGAIELAAATEGHRVVISVSDEGPGLPLGDLFEPFVRGTSDVAIQGTGLGLHVVRSLVEAMGGTVEASRAPSGGALFRVKLPTV